jgi:hypothetical protein
MRQKLAAIFAITVSISSATADEINATRPTLLPGKPAGVHKAQISNDTIFIGTGLAILAVGVAMALGTYNIPGSASSTASTTS